VLRRLRPLLSLEAALDKHADMVIAVVIVIAEFQHLKKVTPGGEQLRVDRYLFVPVREKAHVEDFRRNRKALRLRRNRLEQSAQIRPRNRIGGASKCENLELPHRSFVEGLQEAPHALLVDRDRALQSREMRCENLFRKGGIQKPSGARGDR